MFFITALLVQIFTDTYLQAASITFSCARIMHWGALIPAFAMINAAESVRQASISSEVGLNSPRQANIALTDLSVNSITVEAGLSHDGSLNMEQDAQQLNIEQFEQLLLRQAGDKSPCSTWLDTVSTEIGSLLEHLQTRSRTADQGLGNQYQPVLAAIATICAELQNEAHFQTLASLGCIEGTNASLHSARREMSLSQALYRCGLAGEDVASQLQFIKTMLGPISDGVASDCLATITVPFDMLGRHVKPNTPSSIGPNTDLTKCVSMIRSAVQNGHLMAFIHTADFLGKCEWLPATESVTVKQAATEWHQLELSQRLRRLLLKCMG